MKKTLLLFSCILLTLTACNKNKAKLNNKNTVKEPEWIKDPHTYAKPEEAVVTSLDLKMDVSFESKKINGTARWSYKASDSAKFIYFDVKNVQIISVTNGDSLKLPFELGTYDAILGQPLKIDISKKPAFVEIRYLTTDSSEALQWLTPDQTAGKKYPFLYTQSEAVFARTWLPCQDSPGIRYTYTASVSTPPGFMAVMSAENPTEKTESGLYNQFKQSNPIPAYLMALAVGDLEFKSTGPRTGVYAEPVTVDTAAWEFAETEKMVAAAEKLFGPYVWGRYDVLVLPPSFPYGGMENPMLTFATPTVLAGDRSLTALIAHELAHSWSGNLVTNATWNDFWLNEGFTVYCERRIMESLYGTSYTDMLSCLGYGDLQLTMGDFLGAGDSASTHLKLSLEGSNPEDGMSDVAYEKGYMLLAKMEKTVGREKWDTFLRKYFAEFKFKSMTSEKIEDYVYANLFTKDSEEDKRINMNGWIFGAGLPVGFSEPSSDRLKAAKKIGEDYLLGKIKVDQIDASKWTSHEYQQFLRTIKEKVTIVQMTELDARFHFTESGNSEILALWLEATGIHEYKPGYKALKNFLNTVGRRKFLVPVYVAMLENPNMAMMARQIYTGARKNYHAISQHTLDEKMKIEAVQPTE